MSSVRQARKVSKYRDATEWPSWTDESLFEPSDASEWAPWTDAIRVVPTPDLPPIDDDEADQVDAAAPPAECPDPATTLPAADWLDMQAALHRDEHEHGLDPLGAHHLAAGALAQLARGLRGQHARGILASAPARVQVPDRNAFGVALALELVDLAALLYPYDSAVRRLAARSLVYLAREVEMYGSTTADEYLMDSAAALAAAVDAMAEGLLF